MDKENSSINLTIADFVSETITQIAEGLQRAQNQSGNIGVKIFPYSYGDTPKNVDISFDLAVTQGTERNSEGKAKISILFAGVDLGGEKGSKLNIEAINRVQFTLPIHFTIFNSPNSKSPDWHPVADSI